MVDKILLAESNIKIYLNVSLSGKRRIYAAFQ